MDTTYNPILPALFEKEGIAFEDLMLIDVGCSGGIEGYWKVFKDKFQAIGFDPLVAEISRLNSINKNPKVQYEEGFITWHNLEKKFPVELRNDPIKSKNNNVFTRTSTVSACKIKGYDYIKHHFNDGQKVVFSKNYLELDHYLNDKKIKNVDFLKIDTDGSDFHVLLGAKEALNKKGVLGILVEAQFHGSTHKYANTFSNIDCFLRENGFSLFKFPTTTYTKAALPGSFLYNIFAQTHGGAIDQGDGLYFRDLGDMEYTNKHNFSITRDKLIKLACLFELFKLQDCSVELLVNRQKELQLPESSQELLLNALTPAFQGQKVTYKEYMSLFHQDPTKWFPMNVSSVDTKEKLKTKIKSKLLNVKEKILWR